MSEWISELLESSDTLGRRRTDKREPRSTVPKYAVLTDRISMLKSNRNALTLNAMMATVSGSCSGDGEMLDRVLAEKSVVVKDIQTATQLQAPGYISMEETPKLRGMYANEMSDIADKIISKEIGGKQAVHDLNDLRDKAAKATHADAVLVHHILTGTPKQLGKPRSRPLSKTTRRSYRSKSPLRR